MSDNEIFEVPQEEVQQVAEPTPKPARKKREMTEAQRQQALENLKKGRETARKNRLLKNKTEKPNVSMDIAKEPNIDSEIKVLRDQISQITNERKNKERQDLLKQMKAEIDELRKEQKEQKASPVIKQPERKPAPKPEPKSEPKQQAPPPQPVQPAQPQIRKLYSSAPWV
jgi:hypothetical protein